MEKKTFRTYTDLDGKKYYFDTKSFRKYVKDENNASKKRGLTSNLKIIKENIANEVGVGTDAVENWYKGANGPGYINDVKTCARVLRIDYHKLLIAIEKPEEKHALTIYETEVIKYIFQESIAIIYNIPEYFTTEEWESRFANHKNNLEQHEKKNHRRILELHMYVDKNALYLTNAIRYRLHRFLIEMDQVVNGCIPYRWDDITDVTVEGVRYFEINQNELNEYLVAPTREHVITYSGLWYISEEIDLAGSLGFDKYVPIPDEKIIDYDIDGKGRKEDGTWMTEKEMLQYGFFWDDSDDEWEITPPMIYLDKLTNTPRQAVGVARQPRVSSLSEAFLAELR